MTGNKEEVAKRMIARCLKDNRHIEARWFVFALNTLPDEVSREQYEDQRAAFFCGALALFSEIATCSAHMDVETGPTQADLEHFRALRHELKVFACGMGDNDFENVQGHAPGHA